MFVDKRRKSRRILSDSEVNVAPEASDLLFESEDVAELLAEVTGQVVDVTADSNEVVFSVGEGDEAETFTVTAEGDEEVLESSRRNFRSKTAVSASRKPARTVSASTSRSARKPNRASRSIRKIPSSKR